MLSVVFTFLRFAYVKILNFDSTAALFCCVRLLCFRVRSVVTYNIYSFPPRNFFNGRSWSSVIYDALQISFILEITHGTKVMMEMGK